MSAPGELDPQRLQRLAAVAQGTLAARLAALFVQNAPDRLAVIAAGVSGDLEPAARAAHGLGPMAAQVGALALSELAGQAELAAKAGDRDRLGAVCAELKPVAERALAYARQYLPQDLPPTP